MKRCIFVIRQAFGTVLARCWHGVGSLLPRSSTLLVRSSTLFERGYTERIVCEEYEKGE